MRKYLYFLLLPILAITGCAKDQSQIDDQNIKKYISANNLTAVSEPNGLYYVNRQTGTGASPNINSTVYVNYTGYFLNGVIFDQSTSVAQFTLSQTIAGWQEGIPLMKKGGKCTLLVPSLLGYGASGYGTIPGNTVLVFDIELVNFN